MSRETAVTADAVMAALSTVQEPELGRDLVTLGMIRDLSLKDGRKERIAVVIG